MRQLRQLGGTTCKSCGRHWRWPPGCGQSATASSEGSMPPLMARCAAAGHAVLCPARLGPLAPPHPTPRPSPPLLLSTPPACRRGPPKSSRDDPDFVRNFHKYSRLHFIGGCGWVRRREGGPPSAQALPPTWPASEHLPLQAAGAPASRRSWPRLPAVRDPRRSGPLRRTPAPSSTWTWWEHGGTGPAWPVAACVCTARATGLAAALFPAQPPRMPACQTPCHLKAVSGSWPLPPPPTHPPTHQHTHTTQPSALLPHQDCFFASVSEVAHPVLKGKPVVGAACRPPLWPNPAGQRLLPVWQHPRAACPPAQHAGSLACCFGVRVLLPPGSGHGRPGPLPARSDK